MMCEWILMCKFQICRLIGYRNDLNIALIPHNLHICTSEMCTSFNLHHLHIFKSSHLPANLNPSKKLSAIKKIFFTYMQRCKMPCVY
jgi:hypothetical protein